MATLSLADLDALATLYRIIIDSGEFIVIVVAVDNASHEGRPSFRAEASCSILLYTVSMCCGAGMGPGRAWDALMSALRL